MRQLSDRVLMREYIEARAASSGARTCERCPFSHALDQPCPSNRSRPRLSSELPDSIVEPQSRTSLRSSQDDGVGRSRVCVNCGVYEPFQNITDICCRTVHGVSCVFRDADANNDEADDVSDSEDSGPIELEEVPLSPRTQRKLNTHVAQNISSVMNNRGAPISEELAQNISNVAQAAPQSRTDYRSSPTAKASGTAVALRAFPDRIAPRSGAISAQLFKQAVPKERSQALSGKADVGPKAAALSKVATAGPSRS